jgi:predicted acetyltransferase
MQTDTIHSQAKNSATIPQKKALLNPMKITPATETNTHIYHNLIQCYEAEFSHITGKKPNASGLFELDTHLGDDTLGFLLEIDNTPAGIAAIRCKEAHAYEVCEFYVVSRFRKNGIGMKFAHAIWKSYPGEWEIKQIQGAEYATAFWRKTIKCFIETEYSEECYDDPYWGIVTRQTFTVN